MEATEQVMTLHELPVTWRLYRVREDSLVKWRGEEACGREFLSSKPPPEGVILWSVAHRLGRAVQCSREEEKNF